MLLPPFYAPTYAQVAHDVHSLGVGIAFGIITAIGLTALFESLQVIEDPFVSRENLEYLSTLDSQMLSTALVANKPLSFALIF